MRRHLRLLVLLVLLALTIYARAGLAGDDYEPETPLPAVPAVPAAPASVTEYGTVTEDGSRVVARHADTWIWMRIDSAPTHNCRPRGASLGMNFVQMGQHRVRRDGTFRLAYSYDAEAQIQRGRLRGAPVWETVPKRVDVRIRGRVADGRVTGRAWRRDRLGEGAVPQLDCTRRIAFDARPAG